QIVDMGRPLEIYGHRAHRESDALARQLPMMDAKIAQEFGPRPLEEFQIGRVIDVAGKIGVFVIDPDRKTVALGVTHRHPPRTGSPANRQSPAAPRSPSAGKSDTSSFARARCAG